MNERESLILMWSGDSDLTQHRIKTPSHVPKNYVFHAELANTEQILYT